jgi:flagellar biosynthesis chaperone FliJ
MATHLWRIGPLDEDIEPCQKINKLPHQLKKARGFATAYENQLSKFKKHPNTWMQQYQPTLQKGQMSQQNYCEWLTCL